MPVPLAIVGIGVGASIIGSLMRNAAQRRALGRQARFEEAQAAVALQEGEVLAWSRKEQAEKSAGAAVTAFATSGVDISSGSPADALNEMSRLSEYESATIRVRAGRIAWAHRERAKLLRAGQSDLSAAGPIEALASGIGAYTQFTAIGKPPNGTG